jgi:hypothetical protein
MKENIVGLHIAVHDVVLVEHLEGFKQLLEYEQGILF